MRIRYATCATKNCMTVTHMTTIIFKRECNMADRQNTSGNETILVSSGDEDEDEDVEGLFKEFVSKVERCVDQNDVVLFLKLKFAEARSEFVSSVKFKNALKWRTREMNKSNGYIYTGDICKLLLPDSKVDNVDEKANDVHFAGNGQAVSPFTRVEGDVNRAIELTVVDSEPGYLTTDKGAKLPETAVPSTSSTSSIQPPSSGIVNGRINEKKRQMASPSKQPLTPRKRKKLVKRMELKLKNLAERIQILNQAELSLDEMDMSDSTYIQECRLKEKFNQIWNKICRVQGKPPNTGRVTEKEVKCPTTGLPGIDHAIKKFIKNKKGRFPDKFDISNVIQEANKKYGLKLSTQALNEISDEVFMCIGNILQKRRKRDFNFNFGCHLTDDCNASNDPAINDLALRKKLEENKKVNKKNLDEVFTKFVRYGRMKAHDSTDTSSSSDVEEERPDKSDRVTMKKRFSCISVTQSSDSSENECNDFGLTEGMNDSTKKIRREEGFDDNESDLQNFSMKSPHQLRGKKKETETETKLDMENNTPLQSNDRNLWENSAIVELPTSALSECNEICVKHKNIVKMDGASQPSVVEILEQTGTSGKENTLPDQPAVIAPERINNSVVSTNQQPNDSSPKSDRYIVSAIKEDLTTEPVETSSKSSVTNNSPSHVISSVDDLSLQETKPSSSTKSDSHVITVDKEGLTTEPEETFPESKESSTSSSHKVSNIDNSSLHLTKSSLSSVKSDPNVITFIEEELAAKLVETLSESQETSTFPSRVISSSEDSSVQDTKSFLRPVLSTIKDFDDKAQDVIGNVTGSSFHSDVDNREVVAGKSPKENGSHDDAPKSTPSRKRKGVNFTLSPLTVNIKPISIKGHRIFPKKRKAENGLLDFESPLKSFREATLEIRGNQPSSSCNLPEAINSKLNFDCNNRLSKIEKDEPSVSFANSPPDQSINSDKSGIEATASKRLLLSLNKTGRNSPIKKQETSERTVISIVLSDDDDSDCEIIK